MKTSFNRGDIVLAKCIGYPPWPATINSINKDEIARVIFIGVGYYARMRLNQLRPFDPQHLPRAQNQKMKNALEQAVNKFNKKVKETVKPQSKHLIQRKKQQQNHPKRQTKSNIGVKSKINLKNNKIGSQICVDSELQDEDDPYYQKDSERLIFSQSPEQISNKQQLSQQIPRKQQRKESQQDIYDEDMLEREQQSQSENKYAGIEQQILNDLQAENIKRIQLQDNIQKQANDNQKGMFAEVNISVHNCSQMSGNGPFQAHFIENQQIKSTTIEKAIQQINSSQQPPCVNINIVLPASQNISKPQPHKQSFLRVRQTIRMTQTQYLKELMRIQQNRSKQLLRQAVKQSKCASSQTDLEIFKVTQLVKQCTTSFLLNMRGSFEQTKWLLRAICQYIPFKMEIKQICRGELIDDLCSLFRAFLMRNLSKDNNKIKNQSVIAEVTTPKNSLSQKFIIINQKSSQNSAANDVDAATCAKIMRKISRQILKLRSQIKEVGRLERERGHYVTSRMLHNSFHQINLILKDLVKIAS